MKTIKKVLLVGLFVIGGFSTLLVIGALLSSSDEQKEPEIKRNAATSDRLSENYKASYMEGCMEGSEDVKMFTYCNCTYEYLDEELSNEEFKGIMLEVARGGDMPDVALEAVDSCL